MEKVSRSSSLWKHNFGVWYKRFLRAVLPTPQPKVDLHDLLTLQRTYPFLLSHSGISVHQGLLLVGPPGCGKTYLALAAVGEAGIRCIHVKGPELLGKFIGSSEAAVRDVFQRAQAAKPCAILFDEIESFASKRGGDTTGVTDRVVNQLLCYLDGIEERKDVFVIATTSRPDLVDAALLRPGRLEKVCFCGLPASDEERTEILAVSLKSLNAEVNFDVNQMGRLVPCTFTAADIQAAVNQAQLRAVQEVLAAKDSTHDPETVAIGEHHFMGALQYCRPSLSVQEVQRYHRYCLPHLSQAYQEKVHRAESLVVASAVRTRKSFNECFSDPQRELVFKGSDNSSVLGSAFQGFGISSKSASSSCAMPERLYATGDTTWRSKTGTKESFASELDDEVYGVSKLVDDLHDRKFTDGRTMQKRRRRRKGILPQLTGNHVALA